MSSFVPSTHSYKPTGSSEYGEDLGLEEVRQLGSQEVQEGEITVRLYTGYVAGVFWDGSAYEDEHRTHQNTTTTLKHRRIARGQLSGTRVWCKVLHPHCYMSDCAHALHGACAPPFVLPLPQAYPKASLANSDALAANELATHAALQPPNVPQQSPYLTELLGGFQVTSGANAGEQWLVFKNDGVLTAADYAAAAAGASAEGVALGEGEFWDRFDVQRVLRRRQVYITSAMRQALCGLAFMHTRYRLHQSLGPYSLTLSSPEERDARVLTAKIRDLGFAVDVSDAALYGGPTLADIWERGTMGTAAQGPGYGGGCCVLHPVVCCTHSLSKPFPQQGAGRRVVAAGTYGRGAG